MESASGEPCTYLGKASETEGTAGTKAWREHLHMCPGFSSKAETRRWSEGGSCSPRCRLVDLAALHSIWHVSMVGGDGVLLVRQPHWSAAGVMLEGR